MDRYTARMTQLGTTQRERIVNRLKTNLNNKLQDNPSYKSVKLNGEETHLIINTGTQPYYKEFQSLPDQEINIGDYVEFANSYWLVMTCDYDDEVYKDGKLYQCNYLLKWQNEKGEIIERWAVILSASKYNDGTEGNNYITLGSDQLSIAIPLDEESLKLKKSMSKKFFIDNNKDNPTTYELTGTGNVPDTYNGHGVTSWIVKECAYSPTEDDLKYGVCNYVDYSSSTPPSEPTIPDETEDLCAKITFKGEQELKIGGNYKTLTGSFVDKDGNTTSDIGEWDVITIDELKPYVDYTITDNILKIKILENDFADSGKVRITFSNSDGTTSTYLDFEIVTMF